MKNYLLLILLTFCTITGHSQELSAQEIIEASDKVFYPENYSSVISMISSSPGKRDKSMTFETLYKKGVGTRMEISFPVRSKGMRFLQKDNTLFMYNPKSRSKRAVRLSPKDSFQGSAFSNSDVSDPNYGDDYISVILPQEVIDHKDFGKINCHVIEGRAKSRKTSYAKIKMWITLKNKRPLQIEYYAKSGLLIKRLKAERYKEMAGGLRPSILIMESMEIDGLKTIITLESLTERKDLKDGDFSQAALTK